MTCQHCNRAYIDPPFRCIECEAELGWRCTACQHGNALHYRYCGKCGTPIPTGLSAIIARGEQMRLINITQFSEAILGELMEERLRLTTRKKVKNLSQSAIDDLFA
jgi:hypothetical protein